ncbi:SPOR domain-containing protein [Tropicimonas aquimaris]|uniref:SPOR domain-containing protein n=1 Tax=Tropicimonas aquimaris TaxID=914152 RepID=A0ABW3IS60_9RHOB
MSDQGLWDGRPSLGGVWVAHPDVTAPERVVIRNESNGQFVIGALFKRERENPGPTLQVSSDAASALGLLAGQPTPLNVTALRREEPAAESAPAPAETVVAEVAEPAAPAPAAPLPTPEPAGEAIAAGTIGGSLPDETQVAETTISQDTEALGASAAAVAAIEPAPTRKRQFWNPFRKKAPIEEVTPVALTPSEAEAVALATTETLTSEPLAAVADEPASAPAAIQDARKAGASIDKPYVQIGIFSVEANANSTAEAMRQNGVVPKVYEQESSGKTFWRVVVGPATSTSDRSSLLKKVKALGFADAYPVNG